MKRLGLAAFSAWRNGELLLRLADSAKAPLKFDYQMCAMLRDNVHHHLAGDAALDFSSLYRLADSVWSGPVALTAGALRRDVVRSWAALAEFPIALVAISSRTRAALTGGVPLPLDVSTELIDIADRELASPVFRYGTIGQLFSPLVGQLLMFCDEAGPDARIEAQVVLR